VAGMTTAQPFDARAMQRVHRLTGGVPRRINLLCDRALLGAYASGQATVTAAIIDKAAGEVFEGAAPASPVRRSAALNAAAGVLAGGALVGAVWWVLGSGGAASPATRDTVAVAPAGSASTVAKGASAAVSAAAASAAGAPASAAAAVGGAEVAASGVAAANGWIASEADAWRALAQAWNLSALEGDPCAAALRQQVQCYRSDGISLALVRQLGRPGVLTLVDDTGKRGYVLLTGLNDQTATLVTTAGPQTVPLAQLAGVWRGEFATLWRVPDGPRAQALATQLAVVEGQPATEGQARASLSALRPRVQAFQVAQGLVPDGVAGPMTQMQLNRATGVDEPRLLVER
jgi:general secretion pathway protein A